MTARITGTPTQPDSRGVYRAAVEIFDPTINQWKQKANPSSFFPDSWTREQVLSEILSAFSNRTVNNGNYWEGTSQSGLPIGGYLDDCGNINTAFPFWQP